MIPEDFFMSCTLIAYQIEQSAPPLVPGQQDRDWMDGTSNRFAYRCLPLTIANCSGWQLLCPTSLTIYWNGGPHTSDMRFEQHDQEIELNRFATSHFGHGIVTFHAGYLFRTDQNWGLWTRGAPNYIKDGVQALDGLIETDWLPFTFTMNWLMTRPGFVHFEKGEPFCFITPIPHLMLDSIKPIIKPIASEPDVEREYRQWSQSRNDFNSRLRQNDPEALAQGWQKNYMHGKNLEGDKMSQQHISKRRLATPRYEG